MESIFTEVSSQNGHAGGIPNDSEIEVTSVSSMNGDHSGDTALEHGAVDLVSQEDMAIFNRLCQRFLELTKHLNREHNCLKETHFKDYTRLPELKEVLRSTDAACREYGRCLAEVVSRLTEVRQALTSVSDVIDAKLTSEGVRSWIPESEPPEKGKAELPPTQILRGCIVNWEGTLGGVSLQCDRLWVVPSRFCGCAPGSVG